MLNNTLYLTVSLYSVWFRVWPGANSIHSNNTTDLYTNNEPLIDYNITVNFIYIAGVLIGVGGTMLLVTSLSMVADLIGDNCVCSL